MSNQLNAHHSNGLVTPKQPHQQDVVMAEIPPSSSDMSLCGNTPVHNQTQPQNQNQKGKQRAEIPESDLRSFSLNESEHGDGDGVGNGRGGGVMTARGEKKRGIAHVEVRVSPTSKIRFPIIRDTVHSYIQTDFEKLEIDCELDGWRDIELLAENVEMVVVTECSIPNEPFPSLCQLKISIHVYQPSTQLGLDEFAATTGDDDDDEDDETVMAATVRDLPSRELDGLWNSLVYPDNIKPKLLNYIYSTLLFSDANVDFNIVTWNRVVLLHGPPGTGKTSLCRALAQKLAIRLSGRYSHGKLVEINSHSLFSKWFSESGKLVQKLFARVTEMVEDEQGFVVVLIDEVESLTAARAGAASGNEPSDAIRVVNALLTQLDKLKNRKNVLVMSTSNIAQAIDSAFVDRADIKQYIGLPPPEAVYWILSGCLTELMRAEIIEELDLLTWKKLGEIKEPATTAHRERIRQASLRLVDVAEACQGMSGRTLRRLPVLAHARYIGFDGSAGDVDGEDATPVETWIEAIEKVCADEGKQLELLETAAGGGGAI